MLTVNLPLNFVDYVSKKQTKMFHLKPFTRCLVKSGPKFNGERYKSSLGSLQR